MRKLLLFFTIIFLVGCKTKKIDATKEKEVSKFEAIQKLDSLTQVNLLMIEELRAQSLLENIRFQLETITDTNGIVQPLEYKHVKNGELVEEITLKGGKLLHNKDTKKEQYNQTKTTKKDEKKQLKKELETTENKEVKKKTKQTDVEVTGFQSGFYLTAGISLVAIAIILFFLWRLGVFKRKENSV